MPQVAIQQPQDLNSIFGATSALPGFFGAQQIQQANQINQQNLASAVQSNQIEAAKAPVDLAHIASQTGLNNAQTGLLGQQTQDLSLKNAVTGSIPLEQRVAAARSKLATQMSDDDIKQHQNEIQKLLLSDDPEKVKVGQAAWEQLSAIKEKKMELASREQTAKTTAMLMAGSRENAAQIAANARVQDAQLRAKAIGDRIQAMVSNKQMAPAQAAVHYNILADSTSDPTEAQHYREMAKAFEVMNQNARLPSAPVISPNAAPGILVPAQPAGPTNFPPPAGRPAPTAPVPAPAAPAAQPPQPTSGAPGAASPALAALNPTEQSWVARAKAANPNMSEDDIIKQGLALGKISMGGR